MTRNASLVHLRALLVNHAQELNTRTQEYTAHKHKVTSKLYRSYKATVHVKLAAATYPVHPRR